MKQNKTNQKNHKQKLIKIVNVICYIITGIFILTLLLSLIPSNNQDDNKLNIDENGNIQLVNKQLANNQDYYIIGGDIAYQLNCDFLYKDALIDAISNKTISLYWFENTQTNNARWVQGVRRSTSNYNDLEIIHVVYDTYDATYYPLTMTISINDIFNNEGLIMFDSRVNYNETLKSVFKGMYRIYNFDKSLKTISVNYYNVPLDYGLVGVFNLNDTYTDKSYVYGGILHYNTPNGTATAPFTAFSITFENGITFNTDNGIFSLYQPFAYTNYRTYKLKNYDIDNLIYVSNLVLTYQAFSTLSNLLIDLTIKTTYSYTLSELYLPQRTSISSLNSSYSFSFDFTSNFTQFNRYDVSYNVYTSPFYFQYDVHFCNIDTSQNVYVLSTEGEPIVDDTIGNGTGIEYNTGILLIEYNNFIIYDYYSADIQTFLATQVYTGDFFVDTSGDISTAFDVVITAVTSFLPFLSFYIFPNITIASLLLVPLVFSLVLFIFKLFKR